MTIENIIKKIEAETQTEVNNIIQQARNDAQTIQSEANKALSEKLNLITKEGNKRITIMRNIHLSEARRVSRRIILGAREDLINECFRLAKERLRNLPGTEYNNVMVRLIKDSMPLINNRGSVTLTREEDKVIINRFPSLTVRTHVKPGLGGLILESADGKIVVDNTFEAILERKKEDIRTEVANILFPETK